MARKRKYDGETEKERSRLRVREFRRRKKLAGSNPDDVFRIILKVQKTYNRKMGLKLLEEHSIGATEMAFLCENANGKFRVCLRSFDPVPAKTSLVSSNDVTLVEAKDILSRLVLNQRSGYWINFSDLREKAKRFIDSYNSPDANHLWGGEHYTFPFIAMLNEILESGEAGINFIKKKKNIRAETRDSRQTTRRELVKFFTDLKFDKNISAEEVRLIIERCIAQIIERTLAETKRDVTLASCKVKIKLFRDIMRTLKSFRKVYGSIHPDIIDITFQDSLNEILDSYKKTSVSNGLIKNSNYPFIPLDQLQRLLDKAWVLSRPLYYFIILTLSVGGREEEMERLVKDPQEYILKDGKLDYRNEKGRKNPDQFLIQKTMDHDITQLTNPRLSIISRMILFHEKPQKVPATFFIKRDLYFGEDHELRKYHERCMRTTCATMLAFCNRLTGPGKASSSDVQIRLGHLNRLMADTVYAKKIPEDISPTKYFKIKASLIVNGVDIAKHSNLWDIWLLRDYLKRKGACFKTNEEIVSFNKKLVTEAALYNEFMRDDYSVGENDDLDWLNSAA